MESGSAYRSPPVSEAVGIMLRISPNHCNKGKAEYNGNEDDFPAGLSEHLFDTWA
jgi:hypothetical protein